MSSKHIFRILIFAVFMFATCVSLNKELLFCGDCSHYMPDDCIVENDTNYYVQPAILLKSDSGSPSDSKPKNTKDWDVCIPSNLNIKAEDDTFQYICVWSPKTGCQMIYPKTLTTVGCSLCRTRELLGDETCMCTNRKKGNTKQDKSVSRQLYSGSLHIVIGANICCAAAILLMGRRTLDFRYEL